MYGLLFQPMRIGALELKNRLVMPAMNSHLADGEHHFTDQALNYYGERALGGFGLQITRTEEESLPSFIMRDGCRAEEAPAWRLWGPVPSRTGPILFLSMN